MTDGIKTEQILLQVEKIKIDFTPVLFITKTIETFQSS